MSVVRNTTKRTLVRLLVLGLVAVGLVGAPATAAQASVQWAVADAVEAWLPTSGIPGVQVAVAHTGHPTYTVNAGTNADGTPALAGDRFDLSSITKTFTAALFWQAVDRGLVDPDVPVPPLAAVPGFAYDGRFTPRQLLMHQSGLVNYRDTPAYSANPASIATPEAALLASGSQPLLFEPGEDTTYSSSNFLVIGFLLEQVTGHTFDDLLRTDLLVPLGLTGITHRAPVPGSPNFSTAGIVASTRETTDWIDRLVVQNALGLSDDAHAALVDTTWGTGYTAGLWGYAEDGLGHSGSDAITIAFPGTGVTVTAHATVSIWDPATRYAALEALVHTVAAIEATNPDPPSFGPAPVSGTVRIHVGDPDTVYVGNLTITQPQTAGYATIYPCTHGRPTTSTINFAPDQTVANLTITTTDANGDLCITASTATHLLYDHTATLPTLTDHTPTRALDTRR